MKLPHAIPLGLLTVLLNGCSPSAPPKIEVADGISVVESALNAWRNSEQVQTLREGKTSIFVADFQWESGWKLEEYKIVDQAVDGFQARCKVNLTLKDPQGKTSKETAEYIATSAPKKTVTRSSEGW
jgi:hypothetical protein